jgi:hypothetical protein
MANYNSLSVFERGEKFREAYERLAHVGSWAIHHDGELALEAAGIDEGQDVYPKLWGKEPTSKSLAQMVYEIAKYRADAIPRDFIGPIQEEPETLSA